MTRASQPEEGLRASAKDAGCLGSAFPRQRSAAVDVVIDDQRSRRDRRPDVQPCRSASEASQLGPGGRRSTCGRKARTRSRGLKLLSCPGGSGQCEPKQQRPRASSEVRPRLKIAAVDLWSLTHRSSEGMRSLVTAAYGTGRHAANVDWAGVRVIIPSLRSLHRLPLVGCRYAREASVPARSSAMVAGVHGLAGGVTAPDVLPVSDARGSSSGPRCRLLVVPADRVG